MTKVSLHLLEQITASIIAKIQALSREEVQSLLDMSDYHGFAKARFPDNFLQEILNPHQTTQKDVQIEVVRVDRDLTSEVHYHNESDAIVFVMGENEHVENPIFPRSYSSGNWVSISAGEKIVIPAGTPHGFTVDEGGTFYFLSVQSPPIVGEGGRDDYHLVK